MNHAYLEGLVDARQRAWNEGKELIDRAAAEKREMTGEERQKWDRINADLDAKAAEITAVRDRLEHEREADISREAWAPIVAPELQATRAVDEAAQFADFLRGGRGNADNGRGWEFDTRQVAREVAAIRSGADARELRDLLVGTGSAGGTTVPTDLVRTLYVYMENTNGVRRAGATVLTTAGGNNIDLPTVTSQGTAAIVGEGTALAEADPAFGKITLGAYKYAQLLQSSNELLADTGVDLLGYLGQQFGVALARVTESAYVTGSGSNAPQGACLSATVGTAVTTQTGATGMPSYADLVSVVYDVEDIYRMGGASWLMRDSFAGLVRRIVDTTGRPIWEPNTQLGQPDRLLGYPVFTTNALAAAGTAAGTPIGFGNFREGYVIRDAGSVRVERSDDYAFNTDTVTWRAVMRTDGKVKDARALTTAKAPTT